ncbi:hypothetical protein B296_00051842 [Ensete ventricosum]|uniref:Uncharacterized protein n=1 Tax=Ensete ventricosum TaxID=4639 RepID=A0A426YF75_ENSVE|nr:hypothetical protein B296_00051842 [Ensete ventricosum]
MLYRRRGRSWDRPLFRHHLPPFYQLLRVSLPPSLPLDINLNSSGEGPSSDQRQTTEAESDAWFDDSCKG